MTLTEEKLRGDDCPVVVPVVEAIGDASATATSGFPIPSAPPASAASYTGDDATNAQNGDDVRSARYFKNPTSGMLGRALQTQKTCSSMVSKETLNHTHDEII